MDRGLFLWLLGLVTGGGVGFFIASAYGVSLEPASASVDHSAHRSAQRSAAPVMDHSAHLGLDSGEGALVPLVIEPGEGAPSLIAHLTKDPVDGHNLRIDLENFTFSPEGAGYDDVPGEGHAHVYADGVKVARIYSTWSHLDLPTGARLLHVALYTNSHRTIMIGPRAASVTLAIPR